MNRFKAGTQVFHKKMQVMGVVKNTQGSSLSIMIAKSIPLQTWRKSDVEV